MAQTMTDNGKLQISSRFVSGRRDRVPDDRHRSHDAMILPYDGNPGSDEIFVEGTEWQLRLRTAAYYSRISALRPRVFAFRAIVFSRSWFLLANAAISSSVSGSGLRNARAT